MMVAMDQKAQTWDKRSVEIPPGWHDAMHKLSEVTGVGLKYLYSVALDRLLSDDDIGRIEEEASILHRRSRKDLKQVSQQHTPERVENRYRKAMDSGKRRKKG